ncbi:chromosomal replication initiator protein DnaA [bacterium]|nr:chromosomal replication initiator protein DnaA [bacterium]
MNSSSSDQWLKIMWDEFLREIKKDVVAAILKDQCYPAELTDDTLVIVAKNPFIRDFLNKDDRFEDIISALRISFNSQSIKAKIIIESKEREIRPNSAAEQILKHADADSNEVSFPEKTTENLPDKQIAYEKKALDSNIQTDLTFENFVCSPNNDVARATALAVASNPGKQHNPFFLYSGVGLGKTHLMNAIGNYIIENYPKLKILYISAEQFNNEFIQSITTSASAPQAFRDKFRSVDVLLIDDVHFIIGKQRVQEELFQTIETLRNSKRQIVISSDRPPNQMKDIIDRLKSRFKWSGVFDIQPPDLETRIAILNQKTKNMDIDIQDDKALFYIASEFTSNIRELEGALTKAITYCNVRKVEFSLPNVKTALQDLLENSSKNKIDADKIKKTVCEYFNITEEEIVGKRKEQRIAKPRQIAMYLCRKLIPEMSYPDIGEYFGRDHSTAIHAYNKVEENLNDSYYQTSLSNLEEKLKQ